MNYPKRITGAVILLAVIFISSCSGGGKPKSDGKKYDLSFSSIKGPAFTNAVDMDMKIETEVMGMKMNVGMKMNSVIRFDVLPDTAGMKQLKMTYEDNAMTMEMPSIAKMAGKSEELNKLLGQMMGAFKGTSITLLVDSVGTIQDVLGKDEFRDHIAKSMDSIGGAESQKMQLQQSMEQFYDKEQLQNMVGSMFALYNNQPVEIGSTWTRKTGAIVNNMKTSVETKYTLMAVKDGIAEIESDGKLSGGGTSEESGMKTEAEMDGTQKGKIKIQLSNGHLVSGDMNMDMTAKVKAGGMKVPVKVKAVYTMKGK